MDSVDEDYFPVPEPCMPYYPTTCVDARGSSCGQGRIYYMFGGIPGSDCTGDGRGRGISARPYPEQTQGYVEGRNAHGHN